MKRIGLVLIVLGIFVPTIIFPFTTISEDVKKQHIISILQGGTPHTDFRDLQVVISEENEIIIKYSHVLALGISISFSGIGLLILSKKEKKS